MAGIKDVAEKSGVSISTVSYVMSGKRSVRDDTKRKVIEAARSLGYRPKHVEHMDQSIAALLGVGDGALRHAAANLLGDAQGAGDVGARQQHGEFLAADARGDVAWPPDGRVE